MSTRGARFKEQSGFTMAEVLVAVFLFTATVTGISMLMLSGGAQVTRGAMDSTASNLASRKIEEVKSLPFYRPWSESPQDIDDFYFCFDPSENKYYDNTQQLEHPGSEEPYGTIEGHPAYRRTTAVQYLYVDDSDPDNKQLAPAVMNSEWVPREPVGEQTDRPVGGAVATDEGIIHALLIEVKVYYRTEYREQMYVERALVGDLLVTGGANNPVLAVTSVETVPETVPPSARVGDYPVTVRVHVDAPGLTPQSTLVVGFWYAGRRDVVADSAVADRSGVITCTFDFRDAWAGVYNIFVYWVDEGWVDRSFRECFTLLQDPPEITRVENFDWGYRTQGSRKITVRGQNLSNPATVNLVWPQTGTPQVTCVGSIVDSSPTHIVANINLTSVPTGYTFWNKRFSVVVVTSGGTDRSSKDDERVLVNPAPEVTSMNRTSGIRKASYTGVNVQGRYFQTVSWPAYDKVGLYLVKSATFPTTGTPFVQLSGGTFNEDYSSTGVTGMTMDLATARFKRWPLPGSGSVPIAEIPGRYYLLARNPGADNQYSAINTNCYVDISNAVPEITTSPSGYHNYWDVPLEIRGNYFDPTNTTVTFLKDGAPFDPEGVATLTGTVSVGGSYGTGQIINGLLANLINIPNGTYTLRVTDTESGQYADGVFTVSPGPPDVPYYIDPTSVQHNGSRTITVRAKGLYGSCSYSINLNWRGINSGTPAPSPYDWEKRSSAVASAVASRAGKYVQVTAAIPVPTRFKYIGAMQYSIVHVLCMHCMSVTNPQGESGWWEGPPPHPQVLPVYP